VSGNYAGRVVETYEHDYEGDLMALAVEGESIEATSNHPFWVIEGEGLEQWESSEHLPVTPPDAQLPVVGCRQATSGPVTCCC
jgi:hypothetical protein